jgi:hypothetical protein
MIPKFPQILRTNRIQDNKLIAAQGGDFVRELELFVPGTFPPPALPVGIVTFVAPSNCAILAAKIFCIAYVQWTSSAHTHELFPQIEVASLNPYSVGSFNTV